jgi:citrate lyase beta subunit
MTALAVDSATQLWRTLLFSPADDPGMLAKALASGADAVIADLEDAVRPERKGRAREEALRFAIAAPGPARIVRVNDPTTPTGVLDLEAMGGATPAALMVPKATPDSVRSAAEVGLPVVALIESAAGLRGASRIAWLDGVVAVALGSVDLGAELRLRPLPNGEELLHARSGLVIDCAAARVTALDGVFVDLADEAGLRAEATRARALGFRGKLCIHPRQLGPVRAAFAPSAEEVDSARRIVEAYEGAGRGERGAIVLDGKMVDAAVLRGARLVLAEVGTEAR